MTAGEKGVKKVSVPAKKEKEKVFAALPQFRLRPPAPTQFLPHQPFRLLLIGLLPFLPAAISDL
jgi:hypothetical protein